MQKEYNANANEIIDGMQLFIILWFRSTGRGYGGIGRRYGLKFFEPWYGNLPSDSIQIQGTLGYFEWAILSQIRFLETIVSYPRKG